MKINELMVRAKFAIKIKDYEQAIKLLKKISLINPDLAGVYLLLGNSYHALNDYQTAINHYQIAIQKDKSSIEPYNNLGVIYKDQKDYNQALFYFKEALKINAERVDIYYNIANVYRSLKQPYEAINYYHEAIKKKAEYNLAYNNLGITYQELNQYDEAINVYQQGLKHDPNNIKLHYNLGVVYEKLGKNEEAMNCYRKVIQNNPNFVEAHNNLGILYEKQGNLDEAKNCYEDALSLDHNYNKAKNNLALIYEKTARDDKAIALYNEALSTDQNYLIALKNLGRVYQNNNKFIEAENVFEKILSLDEGDRDTLYHLAKVEENLNQNHAIELFQKLLEQEPADNKIRKSLAEYYLSLGRKDQALKELKKIEKYDPDDIQNKINIAKIAESEKNYLEAIKNLQSVLATNPDHQEALLLLGDLYLKNNEHKKAVTIFEKLKQADPENNFINSQLAEAYKNNGQLEDAIHLIEGLLKDGDIINADQEEDQLSLFNQYLNIYEETARNIWEKEGDKSQQMRDLLYEIDFDEIEAADKDQTISDHGIQDMAEDLLNEDDESIPIINIGDMEPEYAIIEEDEQVDISDKVEEQKIEQIEQIKEEKTNQSRGEEDTGLEELRKNSMLGLLEDSQIYEDRRERKKMDFKNEPENEPSLSTKPPPPEQPARSNQAQSIANEPAVLPDDSVKLLIEDEELPVQPEQQSFSPLPKRPVVEQEAGPMETSLPLTNERSENRDSPIESSPVIQAEIQPLFKELENKLESKMDQIVEKVDQLNETNLKEESEKNLDLDQLSVKELEAEDFQFMDNENPDELSKYYDLNNDFKPDAQFIDDLDELLTDEISDLDPQLSLPGNEINAEPGPLTAPAPGEAGDGEPDQKDEDKNSSQPLSEHDSEINFPPANDKSGGDVIKDNFIDLNISLNDLNNARDEAQLQMIEEHEFLEAENPQAIEPATEGEEPALAEPALPLVEDEPLLDLDENLLMSNPGHTDPDQLDNANDDYIEFLDDELEDLPGKTMAEEHDEANLLQSEINAFEEEVDSVKDRIEDEINTEIDPAIENAEPAFDPGLPPLNDLNDGGADDQAGDHPGHKSDISADKEGDEQPPVINQVPVDLSQETKFQNDEGNEPENIDRTRPSPQNLPESGTENLPPMEFLMGEVNLALDREETLPDEPGEKQKKSKNKKIKGKKNSSRQGIKITTRIIKGIEIDFFD